jgi:hypothetical protein
MKIHFCFPDQPDDREEEGAGEETQHVAGREGGSLQVSVLQKLFPNTK